MRPQDMWTIIHCCFVSQGEIGAWKRIPWAEYMASVLVNYHVGNGILPPQKKNSAKFDRGRALLPGGTYPLYPQRRRICVDDSVAMINIVLGCDLQKIEIEEYRTF